MNYLGQEEEQKRNQEFRSQFLAHITHEFRTPLSALNASVEFLLEELDHLNKEEIAELLESIHLSTTGLQTLIDNLLESLSLEAGKFTIHKSKIELCEVIDEALQVMAPLLSRRGQQVVLQLNPRCPQIYADSIRLKQVLVNLLSNASKYGPVNQTIKLETLPTTDGYLWISVCDQGPGVPAAQQALIFEPFSHPRTGDGPQVGIGLGLSLVKKIVEEHGGQVGVVAGPACGSIFWFTIPLSGAKS